VLVCFRFDVTGKAYCWHQPENLVNWPCEVSGEAEAFRPGLESEGSLMARRTSPSRPRWSGLSSSDSEPAGDSAAVPRKPGASGWPDAHGGVHDRDALLPPTGRPRRRVFAWRRGPRHRRPLAGRAGSTLLFPREALRLLLA
jgi:hypothetical protein